MIDTDICNEYTNVLNQFNANIDISTYKFNIICEPIYDGGGDFVMVSKIYNMISKYANDIYMVRISGFIYLFL